MNQENLIRRGRLAELEKRASELDIAISSDIALARTLIDPYEEDSTQLKDQEIEAVALRLCETIRQTRKILSQIRAIKKDLGLL